MHRLLGVVIVVCVFAGLCAGPSACAGVITRVSVSSDGAQADHAGEEPVISADGRYVVFYSKSANLVPGDTNEDGDVFLHDTKTGETTRVSVSSEGKEGHGQSRWPSISADGRYVTFHSSAPDLVAGDTNERSDVFMHDRETGKTTRISIAPDGTQGDKASKRASISADAKYVVYYSKASALVAGDTGGRNQIYVCEVKTGKTTLVSVSNDGKPGNANSTSSSISDDGRYIAFQSEASNLVPGDKNEAADIFVHDRETGKATRVSVAGDGTEGNDMSLAPQISSDGRYVLFQSGASNLVPSDKNGKCDIFMHDRETGKTTRLSVAADGTEANDEARQARIGPDGRYVLFQSRATNLVPGGTNGMKHVFLRDMKTGKLTVVSVADDGTQGNNDSSQSGISRGARFIVFRSAATNLVAGDTNERSDIFVRDMRARAGITKRVSVSSDGVQGDRASKYSDISADGRYVAFYSTARNLISGVRTGHGHVFLHDLATGETTLASVTPDGREANGNSKRPSLSKDGRYVAFQSGVTDFGPPDTNETGDIYVYDRETGETVRASISTYSRGANGWSRYPDISEDGRYVAFHSIANTLVRGDTNNQADVFVRDLKENITTRVSVAGDGTEGNGESKNPAVSGDGRYVAFWSSASDLVPDDTNQKTDIFLHDTKTGYTTRVSVSSDGAQGDGESKGPAFSADGRCLAFYSSSSNLVPGDANAHSDVFVYELEAGKVTRVSVSTEGKEADSASKDPSLSAHGRYVAFRSTATSLVAGDTNGHGDIFVHDRQTGMTIRASVSGEGVEGNAVSSQPAISGDGRRVSFHTGASNLVGGDSNGKTDTYVRFLGTD